VRITASDLYPPDRHGVAEAVNAGATSGYTPRMTQHASREQPAPEHRPPPHTSPATIEAVGVVSEAFETVERARGHLYSFHQLMGHADLLLGDACDKLRAAGHGAVADRLATDMIGRNVLQGRWTFQIVEEFDDGYYAELRDHERAVRDQLVQGRRHLHEAAMKQDRRSRGRAGHESRPADGE
jgi:hypothetical protein